MRNIKDKFVYKKGSVTVNPLLVLLIFIGAAILWVLLAFMFPAVGKLVKRLLEDVHENINE